MPNMGAFGISLAFEQPGKQGWIQLCWFNVPPTLTEVIYGSWT